MKYLLSIFLSLTIVSGIELTFNEPYHYKERLIKLQRTVPVNDLIPQATGFIVSVSKFKNYDELKLRYIDENKKRQIRSLYGKYWKVQQTSIKTLSKDEKKEMKALLFTQMQDVLKQRGATIYPVIHSKTAFIYNIGNQWAIYQGYGNSFSIEAVQVEEFQQKLIIDPDQLAKELNKKGEINLQGIYFDTNKATLKPESTKAILTASALLKKYPTLTLEVQGHTDNVGNDNSNLKLSQRRAEAVKKAIVGEGIDEKRLLSKGYGEKVPIASNDTKEGKAHNRRVMLKKLSGGLEKAIVTIDFIKPLEGFKKEKIRKKQNSNLSILFNMNGKKESKNILGEYMWADYKLSDKKYKGYSHIEILKNYENVLESFGAKIVGKKYKGTQSIYFYLKDRGDGKSVYGTVHATQNSYKVDFILPKEEK